MDPKNNKELLSFLKRLERQDKSNAKKRRDRLLGPFAGTGMRKKGLYKECKPNNNVPSIKKAAQVLKEHISQTEPNVNPEVIAVNEVLYDTMDEERYNHIAEQVNEIERQAQECIPEESPQQKKKNDWTQRTQQIHKDWEAVKNNFYQAYVSSQAFSAVSCSDCGVHLKVLYVSCLSCRKKRCERCDEAYHFGEPFHQRTLFNEKNSKILLPEQFVRSGDIISIGKNLIPYKK